MGKLENYIEDKPTGVSVPIDLWGRVKHPECIKRIVAELSNGTETEDFSERPENLVAYRIEYKEGPCRKTCDRLLPKIQRKGCYDGRVDRVELSTILESERNRRAYSEALPAKIRKPCHCGNGKWADKCHGA